MEPVPPKYDSFSNDEQMVVSARWTPFPAPHPLTSTFMCNHTLRTQLERPQPKRTYAVTSRFGAQPGQPGVPRTRAASDAVSTVEMSPICRGFGCDESDEKEAAQARSKNLKNILL